MLGQAEVAAAAGGDELGGGGEQPKPQAAGLPQGDLAGQGEQVEGDLDDLQLDLVLRGAVEGEVLQAGGAGGADAVLAAGPLAVAQFEGGDRLARRVGGKAGQPHAVGVGEAQLGAGVRPFLRSYPLRKQGTFLVVERTGWDRRLSVVADGKGLIGHAGALLLRRCADGTGLTGALAKVLPSSAVAGWRDRAGVLVHLAVAIVLGAANMSEAEQLQLHHRPLFEPAASDSTARRTLVALDEATLAKIAKVRARVRRHVWGLLLMRPGGFPWLTVAGKWLRGWIVVDLDATMLLHLPRLDGYGVEPRVKNGPALAGRGAEAVKDAIATTITTLPEQLRRSLTWDRGKELAQHAQLSVDTGLQVYFADPHSPWKRGTNENTNGLLRQYFPKGADLSRWDADELDAVAHALNSRPRKTLGWKTPAEALNEHLLSVQEAGVATTG